MSQTNKFPEDIQRLIDARSRELTSRESRELTSRENAFFLQNSREVYKEKKIEILNNSSRHEDVDVDGVEVSGETCLLAQRQASVPVAPTSSSSPLGETSSPEVRDNVSQERGVSNHAPRELTSRETFSGISVQHAKTTKGIKIFITLQTSDQAAQGTHVLATAELKRYDRMREIKARSDDSPEFNQYLENIKQQLTEEAKKNTQIKKSVAIGRLHQRQKRSAWLYDTLALAFFEGNKMVRVMLYLEGEEYEIVLDKELSRNQVDKFLGLGYHGTIRWNTKVPRLRDLPVVKFGDVDD